MHARASEVVPKLGYSCSAGSRDLGGIHDYGGLYMVESYRLTEKYMGGCQNYGPLLDPYYTTAPNI